MQNLAKLLGKMLEGNVAIKPVLWNGNK